MFKLSVRLPLFGLWWSSGIINHNKCIDVSIVFSFFKISIDTICPYYVRFLLFSIDCFIGFYNFQTYSHKEKIFVDAET